MNLRRASNSSPVILGPLLGRGGEGAVHVLAAHPKLVAKIYKKPPSHAKCEKLRAMVRGQSRELAGVAAWPTDLLLDEQGTVRGFLMGRVSARLDAHRLYSPRSRRRNFPDADFRFVVRAAANLARAFAQVHAAGHVIGDVNHGNALIGPDGTVVLIDCDSFQIVDRGRVFSCDVGSPLFTAPELFGKSFRGLRREVAHDSFALAVLLFHLLFQGRHPFAGVFAHGEMTVERAMADSCFAYDSNAAERGVRPPPGTLPLNAFGSEIAALFLRAFAPPPAQSRPTANEWIERLELLEHSLVNCAKRRRHFHPPGPGCCWCDIEALTGMRLFEEGEEVDEVSRTITALWQAIEGVEKPAKAPPLPEFARRQETVDRRLQSRSELAARVETSAPLLGLGVAGLFGVMGAVGGHSAIRALVPLLAIVLAASTFGWMAYWKNRWRKRAPLRARWKEELRRWRREAPATRFYQEHARLDGLRSQFATLATQITKRSEAVRRRHEDQQRQNFLESHALAEASLPTAAADAVPEVIARGIRTAADVLRKRQRLHDLVSVAVAREVEAWAEACERRFNFDPSEPGFVADHRHVDDLSRADREALLHELRQGPELLAREREVIEAARQAAASKLRQAQDDLQV